MRANEAKKQCSILFDDGDRQDSVSFHDTDVMLLPDVGPTASLQVRGADVRSPSLATQKRPRDGRLR